MVPFRIESQPKTNLRFISLCLVTRQKQPSVIYVYFQHFSEGEILRGVTALTRAVSGEKQIYSGNLEILPGIGKPGNFFGKFEIFSGH